MKKLTLNLCLIFFIYSCLIIAGNTLVNFCTTYAAGPVITQTDASEKSLTSLK